MNAVLAHRYVEVMFIGRIHETVTRIDLQGHEDCAVLTCNGWVSVLDHSNVGYDAGFVEGAVKGVIRTAGGLPVQITGIQLFKRVGLFVKLGRIENWKLSNYQLALLVDVVAVRGH